MLAIVIPYYKINFFEETIQSISNQTNKNFKVYIGNDASANSPLIIFEKYKDTFDFTYFKFEDNLGSKSLIQQWERCLALCNNETWTMILGDDDVLPTTFVADFYNNVAEVETQKITVIRFATQIIDQNSHVISNIWTHPEIETINDFLLRKLQGKTRSSLSEYVFKSEVLNRIRFKNLPLAWYSDLLAVSEIGMQNGIYSINSSVVNFRLSGINITSQTDNLTKKNIASLEFYLLLLKKYNNTFSSELLNLILDKFEKSILNNKKQLKYWLQLFYFYFFSISSKEFYLYPKK